MLRLLCREDDFIVACTMFVCFKIVMLCRCLLMLVKQSAKWKNGCLAVSKLFYFDDLDPAFLSVVFGSSLSLMIETQIFKS